MDVGMQFVDNGTYSPGDRYPLVASVRHAGVDNSKGEVVARRVLAVAPYSFTFCAPVKGRWLGLPLLNVFAKEFAYIPPLTAESDAPHASLDPRVTIPAYIEELRTGVLWLRGREAECRAAGSAYSEELRRLRTSPLSEKNDNTGEGWSADIAACSEAAAMELLLAPLLPRLLLRQKDVIFHRVLRCEAPIPCDDPLHIFRYDHLPRGSPPRRLLIVRKPHGIPVHPSGRFRKNSVTAILEDVFGGVDAHRYCVMPVKRGEATEEQESQLEEGVQCMAICHKQYGFELMRVWIGGSYVGSDAWTELQSMLSGKHPHKLKVFVVHRLDTATSGVLLFGMDSASARITAELLSQKNDPHSDIESVTKVGCIKQYLARVRGRFDAAKIFEEQHHCKYDPYDFPFSFSVMGAECADDASKGLSWLRVDRPIFCLSHHESLYWCPDAALTELWLRDDENKKKERERSTTSSTHLAVAPVAGRMRTARYDAASLEAKHERMRQLTISGRVAAVKGEIGDGTDDDVNMEYNNNTVRDQLCQLKEDMKRAITLIRLVAYDADSDESVVECLLLTGRTHQVRVHLASLGHPICGDVKYIRQAAVAILTSSAAVNSAAISSQPPEGKVVKEEEEEEKEKEKEKGYDEEGLLPHGIFLYAWRYTLCYAAGEAQETFEAPPPAWVFFNNNKKIIINNNFGNLEE